MTIKAFAISIFHARMTEITIAASTFLVCHLQFTLGQDDYGAFLINMVSKQYSDFSFLDLYFLGMIGVNYPYKFLHDHFSDYNWMGIAFMLQTLFALYLCLRIISKTILENVTNRYISIFTQVIFAVLFIENITILSHTRFALLFCGIALFNLGFTEKMSIKTWWLNCALFILGMLHRPESSIGTIFLVGIGALVYSFNIKKWVIRFSFPVLATSIVFISIVYDIKHTSLFVKEIEPEIEYKMMDLRVIPMSEMRTSVDSAKYLAGINGLWFDPKVLNPRFLRALQLKGADLSLKHSISIFQHVLEHYRYFLIFPVIGMALVLLSIATKKPHQTSLRILTFQILTFAVIYSLDYTGKLVCGRHFLNLQLITLLLLLFYFFDAPFNWKLSKNSMLVCAFSLLFVLAGLIVTLGNYIKTNKAMACDTARYELSMEAFEQQYSNRIVVLNMSASRLMDHNFSIKSNVYTKNKYLLFDAFNYSLIPIYSDYLNVQCSCDNQNPVDFFNWLSQNNTLYLSRPQQAEITENYMNKVHDLKLRLKPVSVFKKRSSSYNSYLDETVRNVIILKDSI